MSKIKDHADEHAYYVLYVDFDETRMLNANIK